MTPKEVLDLAKKNEVKIVDIKFTDLLGTWQHFSVPTSELEESLFEDGLGFDGSSIRGWQAINNSDMIVIPDPTTAMMDPFMNVPTLSLICNISDPITKEKYSKDPRNVAQKAEAYLKSTGLGDTGYFGPEAEFFIFDDVRYQNDSNQAFYAVDSEEGIWNSGNSGRDEEPNLGYKPRHKEGYFPTSPTDSLQDIRSEMLLTMEEVGIEMECHHHEVATAGQCEIDMRFAPLVKCADNLMWYKYIVKNVAKRHGKTATFMPKPLYGDNGTGMHVHQSIWKGGKPLFAGDGAKGYILEALNIYKVAEPISERLRGLRRMGDRRWDMILDRNQIIQLPEFEPINALKHVLVLNSSQNILSRDIVTIDMRDTSRPVLRLSDAANEIIRTSELME